MRRITSGFVLILQLMLLTDYPPATPASSKENSALAADVGITNDIRYFDSVMSNFMRERGIPGASVAISKNGQFLFRKGYGRAGSYRIVTPWSLFRIGSVSKPVTAMGILKLHEMGKLCLDTKVFGPGGLLRRYVPSSHGDRRILRITVRHLLQHTAGWDQRLVGDPLMWRGIGKAMGAKEPPDQTTLIRYMMTQPLQFTPGSRYAYSNLGYVLLGRVIESVTNTRYESFIQGTMRKIGIYNMKLGHTRRTENDIYEVEYFPEYPDSRVLSVFPNEGMVPPPYGGFYIENMDSTGGWIASASDMVLFFDALNSSNSHHLLKPNTFSMMLEQPNYISRTPWYGMGVVVQDAGRTWWHSGMFDGSTGILTHDESGFTWAVLLNYRLKFNDLDDLIKFAIRRVPTWFGIIPLPFPPLADSVVSQNEMNLVKILIPEHKYPHILRLIANRGYRLIWVDAVEGHNENVFFNTIWTRSDGKKWKSYHGLTSSSYRRRYRSKVAQGYRLLHIEAYVSGKRLRYSAIFIKEPWPAWVAYQGYSPQRHKEQFYKYHKEGFRLVVQSVAEFKGKLYVAAIYDKLNMGEFRVRMGLSPAHFGLEFEKQVHAGRILSYVQAYTHKGMIKFSAIWGAQTTSMWAARHDMTKYSLLNRLFEYAEINVPLACVTGYEHNEGVISFAALWR